MAAIDSVNQSLFFQAAAMAPTMNRQTQLKKSETTKNAKKSSFKNAMEIASEEASLLAEGLPIELAGMNQEEAIVFLKDAVDMAGDELKEKQGVENIEKYRRKISQFLRYVSKNNFEVIEHIRRGRRGQKPPKPLLEIQIINQKLDQLTSDLLYNHLDNLKILKSVDELNGLIINLLS